MKKSERYIKELGYYLSPRYIFGILLIILAFLSAYTITKASDRTITVWRATSNLASGSIINASDVAPIQVRLLGNAGNYLGPTSQIIGSTVLNAISQNDLIPTGSITAEADLSIARVPIPISRERAPFGLDRGAIVDIYSIPSGTQYGEATARTLRPNLILSSISIDSIDGLNNDLGGSLVLTALVPDFLVADLIDSIPGNDFLIVRRSVG